MENDNLSKLTIKNISSANRIHATENILTRIENRKLWAIAIKCTGVTEYYTNGKTIISDKENMILIPKGSSYSWKTVEKGECLLLNFDSDLSCDDIFSFKIRDCTELINTFYKIEREKMPDRDKNHIRCMEWCYHMLSILMKSKKSDYTLSSKYDHLKPAIEYISMHYDDPDITNKKLSDIAEISTVYFRKIFTEVYKIPPMVYVHNIRMKKAVEILKTDHASISDIALSVGYSGIYNFSKMFKKYYGVSPSKFPG